MPAITLELASVTLDQKRTLAAEITEIAARVTGVPKEGFCVFIKGNSPENVDVSGRLIVDRKKASQ